VDCGVWDAKFCNVEDCIASVPTQVDSDMLGNFIAILWEI